MRISWGLRWEGANYHIAYVFWKKGFAILGVLRAIWVRRLPYLGNFLNIISTRNRPNTYFKKTLKPKKHENNEFEKKGRVKKTGTGTFYIKNTQTP